MKNLITTSPRNGLKEEVKNLNNKINDLIKRLYDLNPIFSREIKETLLHSRVNHTSHIYNRTIYIFGGNDIKAEKNIEIWEICEQNRLENRNEPKHSLKHDRREHTSNLHKSTLYIIGGLDQKSNKSIERWTIDSHGDLTEGEKCDITLKYSREKHTSKIYKSTLYIIGGYKAEKKVEIWDIDSNGDLTKGEKCDIKLRHPRCGHTSERVKDTIYIIGGENRKAEESVEKWQISSYGDLIKGDKCDTDLKQPRNSHTSNIVDHKLYIIGGEDDKAKKSVEIWEFDKNGNLTNGKEFKDILKQPRRSHTSNVEGNKIFIIGGEGSNRSIEILFLENPFEDLYNEVIKEEKAENE